MKDRLSKTLNRLKKEKIIEINDDDPSKRLTAYEIKVFRLLQEKYELSLTLNEKNNFKNEDDKISEDAKDSLERINRGESFKI